MSKACYFDMLPIEVLSYICFFQSADDFARLLMTRKDFLRCGNDDNILSYHWKRYLSIRWGINAKELRINRCIDLQSLYPAAMPILDGLLLNTAQGLECLGNTVFFTGVVGEGNRSIAAVIPFAAIASAEASNPLDRLMTYVKECVNATIPKGVINHLPKLPKLPRNSITAHYFPDQKCVQKFSTPFLNKNEINVNNSSNNNLLDAPYEAYVFPRAVSYYEVKISRHNKPASAPRQQFRLHDEDNFFPVENPDMSSVECVAVGLATRQFISEKRLPGWDNESYGYHGDDGAIYHGNGRQLSLFGPAFGCGDVVGCGIDYITKAIFYTLNGRFLGVAFREVTAGVELFPTVGIDASVSVDFNFGKTAPFAFDLVSYINQVTPPEQQYGSGSNLRKGLRRRETI